MLHIIPRVIVGFELADLGPCFGDGLHAAWSGREKSLRWSGQSEAALACGRFAT